MIKLLLTIAAVGGIYLVGKTIDNKFCHMSKEDFDFWMSEKRKTDSSIDQQYKDYLVYSKVQETKGWKVLPFVVMYTGPKK